MAPRTGWSLGRAASCRVRSHQTRLAPVAPARRCGALGTNAVLLVFVCVSQRGWKRLGSEYGSHGWGQRVPDAVPAGTVCTVPHVRRLCAAELETRFPILLSVFGPVVCLQLRGERGCDPRRTGTRTSSPCGWPHVPSGNSPDPGSTQPLIRNAPSLLIA